MADCATQPAVSEIVSRADELYDANKMREGLQYMTQYQQLDEVEVRKRILRVYIYEPMIVYTRTTLN